MSIQEIPQLPVDDVADFWRAIRFIVAKSELSRMEKLGILEAVKGELLSGLVTDISDAVEIPL